MKYGNSPKSAGHMSRASQKERKLKLTVNCKRNVEREMKKSVSKTDVLGYFTSSINKNRKTAKNSEMYQEEKRTSEAC